MGKNQSVEDKSAEPIPPNPKTETEQPIAKKLNIFQRFYKFIVTEKDELDSERDEEKEAADLKIRINSILAVGYSGSKLADDLLLCYLQLVAQKSTLTERDNEELVDYKFLNKILTLVDVNYKNEYEDTALMEACKIVDHQDGKVVGAEREDPEGVRVFELLLDSGADLYAVNKYGQSVLHIAAQSNSGQLIKKILEIDYEREKTLLQSKSKAERKQYNQENKHFYEQITHDEHQTPLHFAARSGSVSAIEALFDFVGDESILELLDYQERTPLYLAAENGEPTAVKKLIDKKAKIDVTNIFGQKAIFWICSKCSDIALEVLDKFQEVNPVSQENLFKLGSLDLTVTVDKKGKAQVPKVKTILMYITENKRLDIISHPVIVALIDVKWKDIAVVRCYANMAQVLLDIVVWNLIGCLIFWKEKHIYVFPDHWWRIVLWGLAVLGILYNFTMNYIKIFNVYRYQKMAYKVRLEELDKDERFCHPEDKSRKAFIEKEKKLCKQKNPITEFMADTWNWYDLIVFVFLFAVIGTHVADVQSHTYEIALDHIRIFAVTIVLLGLKIFETGRTINANFGRLVVILQFLTGKIIVWLIMFFIVGLSFTSAVWMLWGYETKPPRDIWSYDRTFFIIWLGLFGRPLDEDEMNKTNPIMADVIMGLFTGCVILIAFNIFTALLTSTVEIVTKSAEAYFLLQRAQRIVELEQKLPKRYRIQHLNRLKIKYKTEIKASSKEHTVKTNTAQDSVNALTVQLSELHESVFNSIENVIEVKKPKNKNQPIIDSPTQEKLESLKAQMEEKVKSLKKDVVKLKEEIQSKTLRNQSVNQDQT